MSHSRNEHLRALVNYLPGGRMYSGALRTDSNLYKFLYGLSNELKKSGDYTERYRDNILPDSRTRGLKYIVPENEIDSPTDLTDSSVWTETGTSVAAYDAIGLENKENTASTLTDDDAVSSEYVAFVSTIPNDSNIHLFLVAVKKDSDSSRQPLIRIDYTGGSNIYTGVTLDTVNGTLTPTAATCPVYDYKVVDMGDWWFVYLYGGNNNSGNTTASCRIFPAGTTPSSVGSCVVGYTLFQLNPTYNTVNTLLPDFPDHASFILRNAPTVTNDDTSVTVTNGAAGFGGLVYQITGLTVGKMYEFKASESGGTGNSAQLRGGTFGGDASIFSILANDTTAVAKWRATATNIYITLHTNDADPGDNSIWTDWRAYEIAPEPVDIFDSAKGTHYDFIEEWERALGIPDSCFPGDAVTNLELRRTHVLAKLAALGVQTEQDFIDLAALFGLSATISHTTKFEFDVATTVLESVAFPLTFPILFSVSQTGVYQCLVQILKPANTNVTFSTL